MRKILDKKNRAWAVFVVLAIGLVLSVFVFNSSRITRKDSVVEQDIITEALARRKTDNSVTIDISDIVNKYMKPGVTQKSAEDYLANLGFKIVYDKPTLNSVEFNLIFARPLSGQPSTSSVGFHDEIRVFVTVENGLTRKLSGKLFFKAL